MSDTGDKEPVDEERSRLVDNFVQITGSDAVKARDFLEWYMWDIGFALLSYYDSLDEAAGRPRSLYYELSDSFMAELMLEEQAESTYPGQKNATEEKSRRPVAPVERPEQKEQGQQSEPTSHEQLTETMEIDEPTETTVSSELTVSREPTDPTF